MAAFQERPAAGLPAARSPGSMAAMTDDFETYLEGWRRRMREAESARTERARRARGVLPVLVECLVRRYGARRVILWGSLASGGFGDGSDIDLVAEGLPPGRELFRALAELQAMAPEFRVDLVPWEDATPEVREAAERDGEVLHGGGVA